MSRLIESIKIQNGIPLRLPYHQQRMNNSWQALYRLPCPYQLESMINHIDLPLTDIYKLRISYDIDTWDYHLASYEIKPIRKVRLIVDNDIDYKHKFSDREALQKLYDLKGNADDIIIVKNEKLTDSYFCNIALEKDGLWYTPEQPLLYGTQRASLIDSVKIIPAVIHQETVSQYSRIMFFNAMIEFEALTLDTSAVI